MKKQILYFCLLGIAVFFFTFRAFAEDSPPSAQTHARPRIGLVLGGGGARGLAHVGVLKVLEEARIPVDCVVGTSMGSLVGGAFAAGRTPAEMETIVKSTNWTEMLFGGVPRDKQPFRQKQNDRLGLAQFEFGINDKGEILLPKSIISSQRISLFLRQATMGATPRTFDDLAIPFRAVAADIEDGQMVILDKGDLVTAMSASMAAPGAFSPVEVNGRLLVDGGIARNIPVDVARNLCADVVIAVNVGEMPLRREKIGGIFAMADQLVRLLISKNVQPQLESLSEKDVLITPQLGVLGSTDFPQSQLLIDKGEEAARAVLPSLQRYAVSAAEYDEWRAARATRRPQPQKIDSVTVLVAEDSKVNPSVLKQRLAIRPGDVLDLEKFDKSLEKAFASSDLEQLGYELLHTDTGTQLNILPVEKSWGPNYLSFGTGLRTDLNGDSNFTVSAMYRRTWVNQLGAEWKTLIQVGEPRQFYTEFYQPLMEGAWLYVAPYASIYSRPFDIYRGGNVFAKYHANRTSVGVDLGSSVSHLGEIRIGVSANRYTESQDGATSAFNTRETKNDIGLQANLHYDQLDNFHFPSSGSYVHLQGYQSLDGIGRRGVEYTKFSGQAATAFKVGPLNTLWTVNGSYVSKDAPLSEYALLGGLFNLSGYQYNELLGRGRVLGKVQLYYPVSFLAELSKRANYVGVSLEAGHIFHAASAYTEDTGKYSVALYWATDTPLGPFYVAYARGDNSQNRFYIVLGTNF